MKYLLNTATQKVHSAEHPCYSCSKMQEKNQRIFYTLAEIEAYLGEGKPYEKCGICFKNNQERK